MNKKIIEEAFLKCLATPQKKLKFADVRVKAQEALNLINQRPLDISSIERALKDALSALEKYRVRSARALHVSSLYGSCKREEYYSLTNAPRNMVEPDMWLELLYESHKIYHVLIQDIFERGGFLVEKEVHFFDSATNIVGSADMVITLNGKNYLAEIKTHEYNGFSKLEVMSKVKNNPHAFKKNLYQVSLYHYFLKEKYSLEDEIIFIFIHKDSMRILFTFAESDDGKVEELLGKAAEINLAVMEDKPPKRECRNPQTQKAISCPFVEHCFQTPPPPSLK